MAERMIIEPVKRIAENYLETRNKVIENCWHMIVGNDTPKQEDGWLEVMNDRQTKNGIANIYNFIYKGTYRRPEKRKVGRIADRVQTEGRRACHQSPKLFI